MQKSVHGLQVVVPGIGRLILQGRAEEIAAHASWCLAQEAIRTDSSAFGDPPGIPWLYRLRSRLKRLFSAKKADRIGPHGFFYDSWDHLLKGTFIMPDLTWDGSEVLAIFDAQGGREIVMGDHFEELPLSQAKLPASYVDWANRLVARLNQCWSDSFVSIGDDPDGSMNLMVNIPIVITKAGEVDRYTRRIMEIMQECATQIANDMAPNQPPP